MESEEFGREEFATTEDINTAVNQAKRLKANADEQDDGVERNFSININITFPAKEED